MTAAALRADVAVALACVVVGCTWFVADVSDASGGFVAFVIAAAVGELLVVATSRGRPVPTSLAVVAAYALLGNPPWMAASLAAAAWVIGAAARYVLTQATAAPGSWRAGDLRELLQRAATAWMLSGLAAAGYAAGPMLTVGDPQRPVGLLAVGAVTIALVLVGPLFEAAETASAGIPAEPVFVGRLVATWSTSIVVASSAALTAVAHGVLGGAALPLMVLPLLAARVGLNRHEDVRRTYDQTVRAMSRLPELTGEVTAGHGVRVGDLAVAVARELGLPDSDVLVVERAAHLHEIGRLTVHDEHVDDRVFATAGAGIVDQAGGMPGVAEAIALHRNPYRLRRQGDDRSVPMTARVVRTCCDYDRYAQPGRPGRGAWDALERLHLGMAYDHDPVIIQALTRVLERRGVL